MIKFKKKGRTINLNKTLKNFVRIMQKFKLTDDAQQSIMSSKTMNKKAEIFVSYKRKVLNC